MKCICPRTSIVSINNNVNEGPTSSAHEASSVLMRVIVYWNIEKYTRLPARINCMHIYKYICIHIARGGSRNIQIQSRQRAPRLKSLVKTHTNSTFSSCNDQQHELERTPAKQTVPTQSHLYFLKRLTLAHTNQIVYIQKFNSLQPRLEKYININIE